MNKAIAIRTQIFLLLTFLVGALPFYPRKRKITSEKALKLLCKSGQLYGDYSVLTIPGENYRIFLRNTGASATYYMMMQFAFVLLFFLSAQEQMERQGMASVTDNYTDLIIWAAYIASLIASSLLTTKRKQLQQHLDAWLLFPVIRPPPSNDEILYGYNTTVSNSPICRRGQWRFIKTLFRWLLISNVVSMATLSLTLNYGGTASVFFSLILEFRSEFGACVYMILASAIGDRMWQFNSSLKKILIVSQPQAIVKMRFYYLMTRAQESAAQDTLKSPLILCHMKRMCVVIFTLTSLVLFIRKDDIAFEAVVQYIPQVTYNFLIMVHFYIQGQGLQDEMDGAKPIIQSAVPANPETWKEIEKFYLATLDPFGFSAGQIIEFSIRGLWLDAQFQFTVVTVLVQMYET